MFCDGPLWKSPSLIPMCYDEIPRKPILRNYPLTTLLGCIFTENNDWKKNQDNLLDQISRIK